MFLSWNNDKIGGKITELPTEEDKNHLFALLDAFLRDAKTKKAYS